MKLYNIALKGVVLGALIATASCSDDFLETAPEGYISAEDVADTMQKDPSQVQSYITGAYSDLYNYGTAHDDCGLPMFKIAMNMMDGDIAYPRNSQWFSYDYQLDNRLANYRRTDSTWKLFYQVINDANTVIELLKPTDDSEPSEDAKSMLGQMFAIRAYCYYNLINIFQQPYSIAADKPGIPVKTETEYRNERVPVREVYDYITSDLQTAYSYLQGKGISSKDAISEYAVAFMYANVCMFKGDYADAAKWAEVAMKGATLNSAAEMMSGFNSLDMSEAIWGYKVDSENTMYYASFFSHIDTYMVGYGGQVGYRKQIASSLYDKIKDNDVRKGWFGYSDEYNLLGVDFGYEKTNGWLDYASNKFRDIYLTTYGASDPFTSDIIYFRVAEMYYVAAEAYYLNNEPAKAQDMLISIMSTRIPGYTCTLSGEALYQEICDNKRIDMFEEGVTFFDIKRRNESIDRGTSVNNPVSVLQYLDAVKYSGQDDKMVYQIPNSEIENNPEITEQNP